MYIPTDWTARCEAKCRKTGAQCPHVCDSQVSNTIAGHPVMDRDFFYVHGRPVRLCRSHDRSFSARAKRLLTLPLIDGGHLSPYNGFGYGSIVIGQDRLDFDNNLKATIPQAWGVAYVEGNPPDGLVEKLPKWNGYEQIK